MKQIEIPHIILASEREDLDVVAECKRFLEVERKTGVVDTYGTQLHGVSSPESCHSLFMFSCPHIYFEEKNKIWHKTLTIFKSGWQLVLTWQTRIFGRNISGDIPNWPNSSTRIFKIEPR